MSANSANSQCTNDPTERHAEVGACRIEPHQYRRDGWSQGNEAILLRHQLTPAARSPYQKDGLTDPEVRAKPRQHCTEERKQDEYRHNDLPRTHDIDHAS